ncbi:helix-turn-helix domain-containing protein [Streptomyces anulatus]
MSPNDQPESPCPGPGCPNTVKQTRVGRKRVYCSAKCGTRFRRHARPAADNTAFAEAALDDLIDLIYRFDLGNGGTDQSLGLILECEKVWKDLKSAVVLQSRDSRMRMPEIAEKLHMSPSALSRMLEGAPGRRERRLAPVPPPQQPRSARHPVPGPPRARRPMGGTGDMDGAAPGHGPSAIFASALSHLHRWSGATHKALGDEVGVDPSYISRAISGERIPSWEVTRKLVRALEADPEEILPLWRAARGYDTTGAADVQAALRGLHTAAGQPETKVLKAKTGLSDEQIIHAFTGRTLPGWDTTERIVNALHGSCDLILPLWSAAHAAATANISSGTTTCTISAGAFG